MKKIIVKYRSFIKASFHLINLDISIVSIFTQRINFIRVIWLWLFYYASLNETKYDWRALNRLNCIEKLIGRGKNTMSYLLKIPEIKLREPNNKMPKWQEYKVGTFDYKSHKEKYYYKPNDINDRSIKDWFYNTQKVYLTHTERVHCYEMFEKRDTTLNNVLWKHKGILIPIEETGASNNYLWGVLSSRPLYKSLDKYNEAVYIKLKEGQNVTGFITFKTEQKVELESSISLMALKEKEAYKFKEGGKEQLSVLENLEKVRALRLYKDIENQLLVPFVVNRLKKGYTDEECLDYMKTNKDILIRDIYEEIKIWKNRNEE